MAPSKVGIAGPGPLAITDKSGRQQFVPLSAFTLSGGKIGLDATWNTALTTAQIDTAALAKLAQTRLDSGDFRAPPTPHPSAAILFAAVAAGTEGNGITITVTPGGLEEVTLDAAQQLTYAGLTGSADAKSAIGDENSTAPVQVTAVGDGTKVAAPLAATTVKTTKTLDVKDTDGKVLVTLTNSAADDATVTVTADADPAKFTIAVTRGPLSSKKVKLSELATKTDGAFTLATATPAPTGIAPPVAGPVRLSGGATDVKASAVAYTS
jgi:hypothetical protein